MEIYKLPWWKKVFCYSTNAFLQGALGSDEVILAKDFQCDYSAKPEGTDRGHGLIQKRCRLAGHRLVVTFHDAVKMDHSSSRQRFFKIRRGSYPSNHKCPTSTQRLTGICSSTAVK